MTNVLIRGKNDKDRDTEEEDTCMTTEADGIVHFRNQGVSKSVSKHPKPEEARKHSPL